MIKKIYKSADNIANNVEFLLAGAKKRRSTAIMTAKSINSDMGVGANLVALK